MFKGRMNEELPIRYELQNAGCPEGRGPDNCDGCIDGCEDLEGDFLRVMDSGVTVYGFGTVVVKNKSPGSTAFEVYVTRLSGVSHASLYSGRSPISDVQLDESGKLLYVKIESPYGEARIIRRE